MDQKNICFIYFSRLALAVLFSFVSVSNSECREETVEKAIAKLHLNHPSDIRISLFADDVPSARHMAFDDQGVLFLSQHRAGKVVALPDRA